MHQSHTVKERVNESVVGLQVGEVVVTKVVAFGTTSEMHVGKSPSKKFLNQEWGL